jgi:tetratricopeptide (TPR) repeat protein
VKKAGTFILILISASIVCGQTQMMEPYEAEEYFSNKRFGAVWSYYHDLLKKDPSNPDLNFKMGVCYLNSRSQKEKAFYYLQKAVSANSPDNTEPGITYLLLADACYQAGDYDEAIVNYEKHAKKLNSQKEVDRRELEDTDRKIEMCRMAKEIKELKAMLALMAERENLNREKHNACTDSSCTYKETFADPVKDIAVKISGDKYFSETNYNISEPHFSRPQKLDTNSFLKEATVAASADGQIILIYKAEKENCDLYVSGLTGNEWSESEKLSKAINTKGWEPNEFISADGNTLYFSSTREGGFGGKDIYKCTKLANGDWSKAINLGPDINTSFDEVAPFIHPNLKTLYFSSNRYKAKEGFDIFTSTLSDSGVWRTPVSVGYRVHKPGEYALKTKDSSNVNAEIKKAGTANKKEKKEKENYIVTFVDPVKTPLTMVKGKVVDKDGKIPDYVEITVTNNETGEVLGVYNTDSRTGKYAFILPPQKNNNITFEAAGYLYHTENMDISKRADPYKEQDVVELVPLATGSKDELNNLFFEEKKAELHKASHVELDKLYNLLSEKKTMEVEISACISKDCSADDSRLAENKVQCITNYLLEKGITKERVATKVYKRSRKSKKRSERKIPENNTSDKFEIKILNI